MKKIIVAGLVLLPHLTLAVTDCRVTEFPDHDEAVCIGDEEAMALARQSTEVIGSQVAQDRADTHLGPRPGRMSRSRVDAAVASRNKLLQQMKAEELKKQPQSP